MVYLRACDITTAVLRSVIKLDLFLIRKKERSYLFLITEVRFTRQVLQSLAVGTMHFGVPMDRTL
jgi:hypothetical protein